MGSRNKSFGTARQRLKALECALQQELSSDYDTASEKGRWDFWLDDYS
jgi:hypothetical protein